MATATQQERLIGLKSRSLDSKPEDSRSSSTLKGLLEKRSSDGSWKVQYFVLHKNKLYYHEPGTNPKSSGARASLDLADVVKVERSGNKLYLYVDEKRKHQLRALQQATYQGLATGPGLDDWERAVVRSVQAARLDARARRRISIENTSRNAPPAPPRTEQRAAPMDRQFSAPFNDLQRQSSSRAQVLPKNDTPTNLDNDDDPDEFNLLGTTSTHGNNYDDNSQSEDNMDEEDDPDTFEIDRDHYRQLIIEFYRETNPDKVHDVDTLISKYRDIGVNEADLLAAIQNKYEKMRLIR